MPRIVPVRAYSVEAKSLLSLHLRPKYLGLGRGIARGIALRLRLCQGKEVLLLASPAIGGSCQRFLALWLLQRGVFVASMCGVEARLKACRGLGFNRHICEIRFLLT